MKLNIIVSRTSPALGVSCAGADHELFLGMHNGANATEFTRLAQRGSNSASIWFLVLLALLASPLLLAV